MVGSTESTATTSTAASTQISIIQPQNQLVSTKLDESNFLIWRQQVYTAIRGYGLEDFITKANNRPSELLTDDEGKEIPNPSFIAWQRQDQLLASWILSSLSDSILTLMVGLESAKEIWHTLETNFTSQNTAKQMQLKLQLQTLRKNNMSIRDYLSKMKGLFDALAAAGKKIDESDQVMHILGGLGSEYNSVVVSVSSRLEPYTVPQIQALLLSFESRLEAITTATENINTDGSVPMANTVTQQPPRRNGQQQFPSNFRGRFPFPRGGRGGSRGGFFRGRGGRNGGNRMICQVCQEIHSTDKHKNDKSIFDTMAGLSSRIIKQQDCNKGLGFDFHQSLLSQDMQYIFEKKACSRGRISDKISSASKIVIENRELENTTVGGAPTRYPPVILLAKDLLRELNIQAIRR
ncbi:hypothetical protein DH2020_025211 [Rehmannia glutinosa]|uniref:Retrotransposon Copia-like N-terminal domain-containing protein n=1 Tax=Rehmannia glutinosa TaxID=99300 RepID=A0ABR0W4K0_REHGL